MIRERKRDWPVIAYKFWARPIGDIPEELWRLANGMNDLWNTLVELHAVARGRGAIEKDKERKKAIWKSFWLDAQRHAKSMNLNWAVREEVIGRFDAASRRAIKEQWELKPHHGLRRVVIPHRFGKGGIPVPRLFSAHRRVSRLKIRAVPPSAYYDNDRTTIRQRLTQGVFRLTERDQIKFETIVHRAIPIEVFVKKALWVGEFNRSLPPTQRWTWSLQLVCEIPEHIYRRNPQQNDRPACGMDLGWRVMQDGEYLRVGMIVDNLGSVIELRLPLDMRRMRDDKKQDWVASIYDLMALDTKIDLELEGAKRKLSAVLIETPAGFEKMRQNGLRRLLQETTDQRVRLLLTEWEQQNNKLCAIRASVHRRIRRRKSWLYQNIAAWLARSYSRVIVEGHFSLKLLSMRSEHPAFRAAAKYRQWAGLGELRTAIKNAMSKYSSEIIESDIFNTTRKCFVCSAEYDGDKAEVYLQCPSGHRWDQDVNAACNLLLSQDVQEPTSNEKLRMLLDKSAKRCVNIIPASLKAVIVPCSFQ